jgi:hypothetical protein
MSGRGQRKSKKGYVHQPDPWNELRVSVSPKCARRESGFSARALFMAIVTACNEDPTMIE